MGTCFWDFFEMGTHFFQHWYLFGGHFPNGYLGRTIGAYGDAYRDET